MQDRSRRPRRRRVRHPIRAAVVLLLLALTAGVLVAPPAQAAPGRIWLQVTDPQATDPVRLQVAATDADGFAAAFTGSVTLAVGRTRSSVRVVGTDGQEEVEIPTTNLSQGSATLTAVLKVGGKRLTRTVEGFIDIPSAVVIRGFGCGVVSPTQKRIAWQVVSVNDHPYQFPAWTPASDSFPSYVHTVHPWVITDSLGQPVTTRGAVVVRSGTRTIGTVRLPNAVRRLLFSVPWPGRLTPGTYTATLTLTDAHARVITATQTITVAPSSAGLCS